jgi:hypothetical protein
MSEPQGWSGKQAAFILGVSPTKATQALEPAFRKVALLMLASPEKTMADLSREMAEIREERERIAGTTRDPGRVIPFPAD